VHAPAGRAGQMNAGSAGSVADVLLFLHADTLPPPGFAGSIATALADPRVVGGAFALRVGEPGALMRAVALLSTARSQLLRLPYGDQGIFVRREAFERLGGYREMPLLEDADLFSRLRRLGRVRILREAVTTSGRRWKAEGALKVILRNWAIGVAYACGVPAGLLARLYGPHIR
jgi:rSAM/selenodomain-associated transferase 2